MLTKHLDLVNIAIIVLTIILLSLWATDVGAQVGPVPTATATPFAPPAGPQATLTPFSDAKKAAVAYAKSVGVSEITVLP